MRVFPSWFDLTANAITVLAGAIALAGVVWAFLGRARTEENRRVARLAVVVDRVIPSRAMENEQVSGEWIEQAYQKPKFYVTFHCKRCRTHLC